MANEVMSVVDPLGNTVFLLDAICTNEKNRDNEIYDDAATVVQRPAMMIEVNEQDSKELYYYRSIGWHHTLLIVSRFVNHRWEAFHCIQNPTNRELSEILKRGRQLL